MWDLWWTKCRWGRFSPSTSVSTANVYSTNCSTITITYHPGLVQQGSSGRSTQSPTAQIKKESVLKLLNSAYRIKFHLIHFMLLLH
jgi:glutamine phosphoribosylpyrophosphate amidotransferase